MKAVSFGFSWALLSQIFLSAAWLLQLLLLFSNTSFMIVLFLYWFRGLSADNLPGNADFFICFSLGFFIAAIDYFVISPFLLGLF
jgi:hypothetical protein